jgi:hypothetical protein
MSPGENIYNIKLLPADCGVDLSVGSERGEYVNQDYILSKLLRPHRYVNLMYCYYPLDNGWPQRASEAFKNSNISFAWDYPYDDYFPYLGGINGNTTKEPFNFMRDIRKHGQDVKLTLTIDCKVSDEHLIQIARDLKAFGRMLLRINHECTGDWFAFNKRYNYQEVADFFIRFHKIIKRESPNIRTVLCIGSGPVKGSDKMPYEKEFSEAIKTADFWSGDYYLSLNWGWPFKTAERGGDSHLRYNIKNVYNNNFFSFKRFKENNCGKEKPLVISEFNADGDVTGPIEQEKMVFDFYNLVKNNNSKWLNGITFYQFRDKGRLGLEIEDPNNQNIGIEQPVLNSYKKIIHDPYFSPKFKKTTKTKLPAKLRWGSFEDSEGILITIKFDKNPVFCEVTFKEKHLNVIFEINGTWFYKKPGVDTIDLITSFVRNKITPNSTIDFKMFCPPANGENSLTEGDDWMINSYTLVKHLPIFRIRYEPTEINPYYSL